MLIHGFVAVIRDPYVRSGRRRPRKAALTEAQELEAYLQGNQGAALDPVREEVWGINGRPRDPLQQPVEPRDYNRSDNRRIPSHDEPPKQRKRAAPRAPRKTKATVAQEQMIVERQALEDAEEEVRRLQRSQGITTICKHGAGYVPSPGSTSRIRCATIESTLYW